MSIATVLVSSLISYLVSTVYFLAGGSASGALVVLLLTGLITSLTPVATAYFRTAKLGIKAGMVPDDGLCDLASTKWFAMRQNECILANPPES